MAPLFPRNIETFVDLFCGGGNVGANAHCQRVIFNDIDKAVIGILKLFKHYLAEGLEQRILCIIEKFNLSMVSQNGYSYYGCNSSDGLANYNRGPFMRLREYVNRLCTKDKRYYLHLYVLVIYAFNNQIRFNGKGEYNLPVGKRDFNAEMQTKLREFATILHNLPCEFTSRDFSYFTPRKLTARDFVYADPPYLITCATYNENRGWNENEELRLLKYLDDLSVHHIRFALSNVLTSKKRTNTILQEWLARHEGDYNCHHLNFNYSNSNYHTIDRTTGSDEVLITNY